MIRIEMLRSQGRPVGFSCSGHAGAGEEGHDIVCSAVSALTITTVNGLQSIAKIPGGYAVGEDGIHCVIAKDTSGKQCEQAELLLNTLEAGLRSIQESYHGYLKIQDREV